MAIEAEDRAKTQSEGIEDSTTVPPMRAERHSDVNPAVETPVEARQGFLGKPVLAVLICALILAVLAWIGVDMLVY